MRTFPEKTQVWAQMRFLDRFERPFTPSVARWRLEDSETDAILIDWTAIVVDEVVEISVPASANRVLNDGRLFEVKTLTIQSDYNTDQQLSAEIDYRVKNLRGFES